MTTEISVMYGSEKVKSSANIISDLIYRAQQPIMYVDQTQCLDLLWKWAWPLRSPRPGWSGMMQAVCQGTYPGNSGAMFLPMIDMSSSDMSCI